MDLDQVAFESPLQWDDALDEQGIGIFKVKVHEAHHAYTHELGFPESPQLLCVVGMDGGCDQLRFFSRAHRGRFDVFESREIYRYVLADP